MGIAAFSPRVTRFSRVGVVMMLLGAVLITAGLIQTTTSHENGGNQNCPSGTVLIAQFDAHEHSYQFDGPSGNEHVVTLSNTSSSGGSWQSTMPVSAVIVKGGPDAVLVSYAPPQQSGTFSNAGLPKVGHDENTPDISNVKFCGPSEQPTSSSSSSSTTTTSPGTSTSTTEHVTTTTEHGTTTTEETSTTEHVTTTTEHVTTTTHQPTTTVSPTTVIATTTTAPATTTTTEPVTTTSISRSGSTVVVTTTTLHQQGSTVAPSSSTTVLTPVTTHNLPFTGGQSTPLIVIGILFLATGLALTLSAARRGRGIRA